MEEIQMGTHCSIEVEGLEGVWIYKHYDGYPEEMLEPLKEFNKDFEANRGDDPSYKFAQLLRKSKELFDDPSPYTGWGVVVGDPSESLVDYRYKLKRNGDVYYE
jgi:hypothetical protein